MGSDPGHQTMRLQPMNTARSQTVQLTEQSHFELKTKLRQRISLYPYPYHPRLLKIVLNTNLIALVGLQSTMDYQGHCPAQITWTLGFHFQALPPQTGHSQCAEVQHDRPYASIL